MPLFIKKMGSRQRATDLTALGYEFHGLKLPAKLQLVRQDIMEKEESTNGEYEVDITRQSLKTSK